MAIVTERSQQQGQSPATVRGLRSQRTIGYTRLGRAVRIPASESVVEHGTVRALDKGGV